MKIKKTIVSTLLLTSFYTLSFGQHTTARVNLLAGGVAIFNPSIEVELGSKSAIVADYMGAFARSNYMGSGSPLILSVGIGEYRQYLLNTRHDGLFLGADLGLDAFRMSKGSIAFLNHASSDGSYDVGYGYLLGLSCGYKRNISERWSVEAGLTGGYHHAQHERYSSNGERQNQINASGEWTLYKAGIYLGYRLGIKSTKK